MHQEDERNIGVKETRAYIDMGFDIFEKDEEDNLKLVKHIPTTTKRDLFQELQLDAGKYLVIPKSSGLKMLEDQNDAGEHLDTFNRRDPIVKSIFEDLFRKFDINVNKRLSYKEFGYLGKILNLDYSEEQFQEILSEFQGKQEAKQEFLYKKGFIRFISTIFDKLDKNEILSHLN